MPSTNILQFNPGAANQENDAAYAADVLRSGGLTVNALIPSPMLNKALFQASTMAAAIAQFIVNAGFNANDTNLATLVSALTNAIIASAPQHVLSINTTPVTVNANTTAAQVMQTGTPIPAQSLNVLQKAIRLKATGSFLSSVNQTVKISIDFGAFTIPIAFNFNATIPGGTYFWDIELVLVVTQTGASGLFFYAYTFLGTDPGLNGSTFGTSGAVNLTGALNPECTIAFGTGSVSNTATQKLFLIQALN